METIKINISSHISHYSINVGNDILAQIPKMIDISKFSSIYIITDSTVAEHYLAIVKDVFAHELHREKIHSYMFEAGERNKKLSTVETLYNDLATKQIDRNALIVNVGGGVVSDLGGFVAATYLRGVACLNIATTLEAMVDASVGGKTGVNLGSLKNYIGVFAQPHAVIIDVNTLKTLPDRILVQGYAEVLKHGLMADAAYFEKAALKSPLDMNQEELIDIITRSVEIKARLVQEDEHESGARKLLNFGHTIGHVIESLSMETESPLYHGEAVAIGMIAEAKISEAVGMITEEEFRQIEQAITHVGLPSRVKQNVTAEQIAELLHTDKKNVGGKIKWTLLMGIGRGEFNVAVADTFVREAIEYILSSRA